jgi:hypothetical protein
LRRSERREVRELSFIKVKQEHYEVSPDSSVGPTYIFIAKKKKKEKEVKVKLSL